MAAEQVRLQQFMEKMIGDLGAAASAALVLLGDRLGLYRALAEAGPLDSAALAARTGTSERHVREWLAAQAAAGFISYDPAARRYRLSPEKTPAIADEG